ncbi:MAG: DUF58 domain-containing protein [Clostridiales bacterium]|nr:DUF58 domain-containing protein [Eubacteriales bacterium]MDH7566237.1 DUF58 domain-containing protein [Clostridiales bacterium]
MEKFLQQIENMRITPQKTILKGGPGVHKGYGRGASMDFYGHTPYAPGEDIRKIDWMAYARTDNLYIKEFSEERRMHVRVLLDASASMGFGGPGKWKTARLVAAGLSYITLKQGDRLSFLTVNDRLEFLLRGAEGRECFYELADRVSRLIPHGITSFERIGELEDRSADMTFVVSDFFSGQRESLVNSLCLEGKETVLIHVLASAEKNPDCGEELKLVDMETGAVRRIHFTGPMKQKYAQKVGAFIQGLKDLCTRLGAFYVPAAAEEAPLKILQRALGVCG